jgi:hypothetical protein
VQWASGACIRSPHPSLSAVLSVCVGSGKPWISCDRPGKPLIFHALLPWAANAASMDRECKEERRRVEEEGTRLLV